MLYINIVKAEGLIGATVNLIFCLRERERVYSKHIFLLTANMDFHQVSANAIQLLFKFTLLYIVRVYIIIIYYFLITFYL